MDEKGQGQEGRRLKRGKGRGGKIAGAAAALALVALAAGYLGLCAYANGPRVLPGVRAGGVDLGGLTLAQAEERLAAASKDLYDNLTIPLQVGDKTVTFRAKEAGVRTVGAAEQAFQAGRQPFAAAGWNYLIGLLGKETEVKCDITVDQPAYVAQTLRDVSEAVAQPVEDPHWDLEETDDTAQLVLHRGRSGQSVDEQAVYEALMSALGRGDSAPIQVEVATTAPALPDVDALAAEIDREPENATYDPTAEEVVPHKLGLTVDKAEAQALFNSLAEGESATLSLAVQVPEITTLKLRSSLFLDVLGEAKSSLSGSANRTNNVKLACQACNGVVLLPGEEMSYNQTTGQRTAAKGYRMAPGYTREGMEDLVGGGVCQPSSTLYLACLRANLNIVQRTNHRYTVHYLPEGMDAMVSWPNFDFVFANDTPYPIKVEMAVENKQCIARVYGTKTDDTYVEMESVRLSSTPWATVYRADPTVPQGTTKTLVTPFTGRVVEAYKNLYAGDGTLISRTLESKNTYQKCDKVIGYNPLDGAPDGSVPPMVQTIDPVTGQPAVDPATGLPVTPAPAVDPATGLPVTPAPAVDPNAGQSVEPAPAETVPTLPPVPQPVATPEPETWQPPVPAGIPTE